MRLSQAVMKGGGDDAAEKANEGGMSGGSPPEHAEQKSGEQGRVHKCEYQLQQVHDVVEVSGEVSGSHTDCDSAYGCGTSHPQKSGVTRLWTEIGLVDIVGPNGVKGGDVAGRSGHERSNQRGKTESQNTGRKIVPEH